MQISIKEFKLSIVVALICYIVLAHPLASSQAENRTPPEPKDADVLTQGLEQISEKGKQFSEVIQGMASLEGVKFQSTIFAGKIGEILGQDSFAEGQYKQAVILDPESPQAYYNLGRLYEKMNRYEDSINVLSSGILVNPDIHLYLARASSYYNSNECNSAIVDVEKVLAINEKQEDNTELLKIKGDCYFSQGKIDSAEESYIKLLESSYKDVGGMLGLARIDIKKGNFDAALFSLNTIIDINPANQEAILERSKIYLERGKLTLALADASSSVRVPRLSRESKLVLARAHKAQGKLEQSLGEINEVISSHKTSFNLDIRARLLAELGRDEEAIDSYYEALMLEPDYLDAITGIAEVFFKKNDFDQSRIYYNKVLAFNSTHKPSLAGLAQGFAEQNDVEEAIDFASKLIKEDPFYSEILLLRANLYLKQYNYHSAIEDIEKRLAHSKAPIEAYELLSKLYSQLGEYEKGTNTLYRGVSFYPDSSFIYLALGERHYEKGKYNRAQIELAKSISLNQKDPKGKILLAEIYLEQEKFEDGAKIFDLIEPLMANTSLEPIWQLRYAYIYSLNGNQREALKKMQSVSMETQKIYDHFRYFYLSHVNYSLGNFNKALNLINKAIPLYNSARFYWLKLKILKALNRWEQMPEELEILTSNYDKTTFVDIITLPKLYEFELEVAQELGDREQAIMVLSKIIDSTSSSSGAEAVHYTKRGKLYFELGDYRNALTDLTHSINSEPNLGITYISRAEVFLTLNRDKRALVDLNTALELNENDSRGFYLRGLLWNKNRKLNNALSDLNQAILLQPEYPEALILRSKLYESASRWDEAEKDLDSVFALVEETTELLIRKAVVYNEKGDLSEAVKLVSRAIKLDPESKQAYGLRSDIYFKMGEYEKGTNDIEKLERLSEN